MVQVLSQAIQTTAKEKNSNILRSRGFVQEEIKRGEGSLDYEANNLY